MKLTMNLKIYLKKNGDDGKQNDLITNGNLEENILKQINK